MADARIDQLADAAKAAIEAAANDPEGVYVTCEDVPSVDVTDGWPERDGGNYPPQPRWVYVSAPAYADAGPVNRDEDATFYTLDVLTVERCDDAGPVPVAWRRERTAWVKEKVVDVLTDPAAPLAGTAVPDSYEVAQAWEFIAEHKVFWCVVTVTFLEHA